MAYEIRRYRFRVDQTITVVDPAHPIVDGLGESFPYRDEAYLYSVFESDVTPLLRSDFTFKAENFRYGGVDFKNHPEGSNLGGWTKKARNAAKSMAGELSEFVWRIPGRRLPK